MLHRIPKELVIPPYKIWFPDEMGGGHGAAARAMGGDAESLINVWFCEHGRDCTTPWTHYYLDVPDFVSGHSYFNGRNYVCWPCRNGKCPTESIL